MCDLLCMGELLIDFTPCGKNEAGTGLFARNPGGAPANVAVQAARLGASSAFVGKVGEDLFGSFLRDTLAENGVNTRGLVLDPAFATTLAFVQLSETGDRDFSFYRNPGADTQIAEGEINFAALEKAKILCFGSLLLTNEPSRSAVYSAVQFAKSQGVITAYDPNWRAPLWKDRDEGIARMKSLVAYVDILKVSDEELFLLTDCEELDEGASRLLSQGVKLVVCTLGAEGCVLYTKEHTARLPAYAVQVQDTTGSGDSFFGAFLAELLLLEKRPEELTLKELVRLGDYANAAGSACATKPGAIPALPTRAEIEKLRETVALSRKQP
ncbi:MAG: carbohydrate kinase [Oscillospiraceae bacterium]